MNITYFSSSSYVHRYVQREELDIPWVASSDCLCLYDVSTDGLAAGCLAATGSLTTGAQPEPSKPTEHFNEVEEGLWLPSCNSTSNLTVV